MDFSQFARRALQIEQGLQGITKKIELLEKRFSSTFAQSKMTAPYGSWKSPISSDEIVKGSISFVDVFTDGKNLFFTEMRPSEGGRYTVLRKRGSDKESLEVLKKQFNARTRVHEYGGAASLAFGEKLFFSNFVDQRLYLQNLNNESEDPQPITPPDFRYSDGCFDSVNRSLFLVREDHTDLGNKKEPENTIVRITFDEDWKVVKEEVVASGYHFYAFPRVNKMGTKLAFICWNHPNMPWDHTYLFVLDLQTGEKKQVTRNEEEGAESVLQPLFHEDDSLFFISDRRGGFWNLFRYKDNQIETVLEHNAEYGVPCWVFGTRNYQFISKDQLLCTYQEADGSKLGIIDLSKPKGEKLTHLKTPFTSFSSLTVTGDGKTAYFIGGSPTKPPTIVELDLPTKECKELKVSSNVDVDPQYFSIPQAISFPTKNGLTSHGFYYPPTNRDYNAPDGEKPPVLFQLHGGPTASASTVLKMKIQYWTSRGFGVLDLDYSGSTGYGREYRDRLKKNWGVADVDDCEMAAEYLTKHGLADPDRLCISGGSAGGFTVLACLAFKPNVFQAAASYYGVSDLELLAKETHKFESRYLDSLIGEYPKEKELYQERSPIHKVNDIKAALALYQGEEDKIVPPNQAKIVYEALKQKGVPVMLEMFPGEQHGFRKSENIKKVLDSELEWYSKAFGFKLPEQMSRGLE